MCFALSACGARQRDAQPGCQLFHGLPRVPGGELPALPVHVGDHRIPAGQLLQPVPEVPHDDGGHHRLLEAEAGREAGRQVDEAQLRAELSVHFDVLPLDGLPPRPVPGAGVVGEDAGRQGPHMLPVLPQGLPLLGGEDVELIAPDGEAAVLIGLHWPIRIIVVVYQQHVLQLVPEVGGLEALLRQVVDPHGGDGHGLLGHEVRGGLPVDDHACGFQLRLRPLRSLQDHQVRLLPAVGRVPQDTLLDQCADHPFLPAEGPDLLEEPLVVDLLQGPAQYPVEPLDQIRSLIDMLRHAGSLLCRDAALGCPDGLTARPRSPGPVSGPSG